MQIDGTLILLYFTLRTVSIAIQELLICPSYLIVRMWEEMRENVWELLQLKIQTYVLKYETVFNVNKTCQNLLI